jgi:hypothetical protein
VVAAVWSSIRFLELILGGPCEHTAEELRPLVVYQAAEEAEAVVVWYI